MKTDELINIMATAKPIPCHARKVTIWGVVAVVFMIMVLFVHLLLGLRPDMGQIFFNAEMQFKYAFLSAVLVGSGIAWWQSGHPCCTSRIANIGLVFLPLFLLGLAAFEFFKLPQGAWANSVFDSAAFFCVGFVALYTVLGSAALVTMTKCMAPVNLRRHALLTLLFASSLGAVAYGMHCQHDNASYLVFWYMGTSLVMAALGLPILMKRQAW